MRGEVVPAREAHENCLNLLSGSAEVPIGQEVPKEKSSRAG